MMKSFLPLCFCGAALLLTNMAHAKDKPLEPSRDNFVSLQWTRTGGFAGISERYTIQNHEIIKPSRSNGFGGGGGFGGGQPNPYSPPQVAPLSENQWKELIEELQKANIPAIAGTYKQEGLSDGFNERLVLTLSDHDNLGQTFVLNNYGGKAPASYYQFSAYLSALLTRKLPSAPPQTTAQIAPAQDKPLEVSNDNFVLLQWTQGSGRGGSTTYMIQSHQVRRSGGRGSFSPTEKDTSASQVRMFSEEEWKELIEQLRKLNVPAIAGVYEDKNIFDGPGQWLVLTFSDDNNVEQTFTILNNGFNAPAAFAKFNAYLSSLLRRKFNTAPASAPAATPKQ